MRKMDNELDKYNLRGPTGLMAKYKETIYREGSGPYGLEKLERFAFWRRRENINDLVLCMDCKSCGCGCGT